ncbi:MAG: hypothetical protein GX998_10905 [Firmicutes bacterium]|nr:hypothetical protein [Bacillota bacterium]
MIRLFKSRRETPAGSTETSLQALLAYQESESELPTVVTIEDTVPTRFLENLIAATCRILRNKRSVIPTIVATELITNLAHAEFKGSVITISADGNQLTVSDHGPGIPNKHDALLFGYYGKPPSRYRSLVRGAGTGLPLAHQLITAVGGQLILANNLTGGTVATALVEVPAGMEVQDADLLEDGAIAAEQEFPIDIPEENATAKAGDHPEGTEYIYLRSTDSETDPDQRNGAESTQLNMQGPAVAEALSDLETKLSRRQRRVLFLVADLGEVGPSTASTELDMSISTAFRDLVILEEMGLVQADANGKRSLTPFGARVIAALSV